MEEYLVLLIFGYLLGSISPGYFFGRLIKKIDIRNYGNHNTGATNTYHVVGKVYGIITGIFDFFKAPFVYFIAVSGLGFAGLNPDVAIIIGLATVVGHIAPFYLQFKGGRGVASLYGLCVITLFYTQSMYSLILIAGTIIYALKVSRRPSAISIRTLVKLFAIILPLGLLLLTKSFMTWVLGILLFISIVFDISRFLIPNLNQKYLHLNKFSKEKERKFLSGYTLFLISSFLIFLIFPKEIVIIAITFFIFGDIFAPIGGTFFPKVIIKDRTWGGAVTIFVVCFIAGIFLRSFTPISLPMKMVLVGALTTTILDLFSFLVDDNILVPLGTALVLSFIV